MPSSSNSFSGKRLQIAREFRRLTQKKLAASVFASPSLLSLAESGKKKDLAPDLVEAIGDVLGFEPEFFYQPITDLFLDQECSFRHRRSATERLKHQLRAHGNLIAMVVERLKNLLAFPHPNVPKISALTNKEIEAAAERCRVEWGLGKGSPILNICRVAEHAGIIVVSHVVETTKVDAFSRSGKTYIIFLNYSIKSSSRWVFDIAHEFGHLVMHSGVPTGEKETERAADRFASAFLMPASAFSREFSMKGFSWKSILQLKQRWRVSAQAIVRRAYDLGLISALNYRYAFQDMSAKGWRSKGEPFEPTFEDPEMFHVALNALGSKVKVTLDMLCGELHFTPKTFYDVTGVQIPKPTLPPVLTFKKS